MSLYDGYFKKLREPPPPCIRVLTLAPRLASSAIHAGLPCDVNGGVALFLFGVLTSAPSLASSGWVFLLSLSHFSENKPQ